MLRIRGGRRWGAVAAVVVVLIGCDDSSTTAPSEIKRWEIAGMLTAEAAASLTPSGAFANASAEASAFSETISADRARALAEAYVAEFGKYNRSHFESLRGARIDFASLRAASQVVLAETAFGDLPPDASGPARKHFGSYYVVSLRSRPNVEVLRVAVSAFAADVGITANGIRPPAQYGNEFRTWVVPLNGRGEPLFSPEEAVSRAFHAFARPVSEAPRFVRQGASYAPQLGLWRLVLAEAAAVELQDGRGIRNTRIVYLDRLGDFLVADDVQSTQNAAYMSGGGERREASLTLRSELASRFLRIAAVPLVGR